VAKYEINGSDKKIGKKVVTLCLLPHPQKYNAFYLPKSDLFVHHRSATIYKVFRRLSDDHLCPFKRQLPRFSPLQKLKNRRNLKLQI
jgi:hypothetical protein